MHIATDEFGYIVSQVGHLGSLQLNGGLLLPLLAALSRSLALAWALALDLGLHLPLLLQRDIWVWWSASIWISWALQTEITQLVTGTVELGLKLTCCDLLHLWLLATQTWLLGDLVGGVLGAFGHHQSVSLEPCWRQLKIVKTFPTSTVGKAAFRAKGNGYSPVNVWSRLMQINNSTLCLLG